MGKRPLSVTAIGYLYLAIGVIGVASHLATFKPQHPFPYDILWAFLTALIAIVTGVYILRGSNLARWVAVAWIAFHVVLSAFHAPLELAIHSLLCILIAYCLFRPPASAFFRSE